MSSSPLPDFDASSPAVLRPAYLAHIVLRTADLARLTDFYVTFLGGASTSSTSTISFITFDEEHHRLALLHDPSARPKIAGNDLAGMHHMAFAFATLPDLLLAYRQRKARGIDPAWCVNHGPSTSIYYRDPDGNVIETQTDSFDTKEGAIAFMASSEFAKNPIGTDFDPEEMIAALRSGVDEKVLRKRKEIGPRTEVGL